ncbi:DAK2 domain-containing protein [Actinoalloteichus spitiensis]|uniref:DAK2 domain-containing protein n=1 Tax=Actinoalloteichus spitiensis TaxID=252394 RepID=UPI00037CFF11|nr:DAK2 domain-containing protein [Actinoalloteichus spitiensis]
MRNLDVLLLRRWAEDCVAALEVHRERIDGINVFPVPDADTGTNLLNTMRAASERAGPLPGGATLGEVAAALATGALLGARGNSGVILSQMLRGLAEAVRDLDLVDPPHLVTALVGVERVARTAVTEPAPGTMLTVLAGSVEAVEAASVNTLVDVLAAAVAGAERALLATPGQQDALAATGVVDAGGCGVLVILDALLALVEDRPPSADGPRRDALSRVPLRTPTGVGGTGVSGACGAGPGADELGPDYDHEVMYLLADSDEGRVAELRAALSAIGDCVSVAGDGAGHWAVHVHCADVGAAVERGIELGRPHRVRVRRLVTASGPTPGAGVPTPASGATGGRAVVAVVSGEGLGELFRAEGAVVVHGNAAGPELDAALDDALLGAGARHVVLLPNGQGLTASVEQAAGRAWERGREVVVVPTASPVQGLAALAVHDPARRPADDAVSMAEAAAATRRGELMVARRAALTWAGRCEPGDVLGLVDGEVVLIADDVPSAALRLLERMLTNGAEIVTVLNGADAPPTLLGAITARLRANHPEVEVTGYDVQVPDAVLLVGVE